jgi:hypothetical protein
MSCSTNFQNKSNLKNEYYYTNFDGHVDCWRLLCILDAAGSEFLSRHEEAVFQKAETVIQYLQLTGEIIMKIPEALACPICLSTYIEEEIPDTKLKVTEETTTGIDSVDDVSRVYHCRKNNHTFYIGS